MPRKSIPAQVHECPKCQYRIEAPLPCQIWCPTRHTDKRGAKQQTLMKVIWDRKIDGGEPPEKGTQCPDASKQLSMGLQ